MSKTPICHETDVEKETHAERWSKDLVGTKSIPTTSGFSIGVAEYFQPEFGERNRHRPVSSPDDPFGIGFRVGENIPVACVRHGLPRPAILRKNQRTDLGRGDIDVLQGHADHLPVFHPGGLFFHEFDMSIGLRLNSDDPRPIRLGTNLLHGLHPGAPDRDAG